MLMSLLCFYMSHFHKYYFLVLVLCLSSVFLYVPFTKILFHCLCLVLCLASLRMYMFHLHRYIFQYYFMVLVFVLGLCCFICSIYTCYFIVLFLCLSSVIYNMFCLHNYYFIVLVLCCLYGCLQCMLYFLYYLFLYINFVWRLSYKCISFQTKHYM